MPETQVKTKDTISQAADAVRGGARGALNLGRLTHEWKNNSAMTMEYVRERLFNDHGVTLPSDSRLSTYRTTYEAWCITGDLQPDDPVFHESVVDQTGQDIPMYLTGVPIDKLSNLKGLIKGRGDAEYFLAFAYKNSEKECRGLRQASNGQETKEQREDRADVKSFKINTQSYERFTNLLDRLRHVEQDPHISRAQLFDFMLAQFDHLEDGSLDYLWRDEHGDLSEDEMHEREVLDVE